MTTVEVANYPGSPDGIGGLLLVQQIKIKPEILVPTSNTVWLKIWL